MVDFGLYEIKGSINVQMAEKTGFTEEDAHLKMYELGSWIDAEAQYLAEVSAVGRRIRYPVSQDKRISDLLRAAFQ